MTRAINIQFTASQGFMLDRYEFADMITAYTNRLYDRQKEAQAKVGALDIGSANRDEQFHLFCGEWLDAERKLKLVDQLDKAFKDSYTEANK